MKKTPRILLPCPNPDGVTLPCASSETDAITINIIIYRCFLLSITRKNNMLIHIIINWQTMQTHIFTSLSSSTASSSSSLSQASQLAWHSEQGSSSSSNSEPAPLSEVSHFLWIASWTCWQCKMGLWEGLDSLWVCCTCYNTCLFNVSWGLLHHTDLAVLASLYSEHTFGSKHRNLWEEFLSWHQEGISFWSSKLPPVSPLQHQVHKAVGFRKRQHSIITLAPSVRQWSWMCILSEDHIVNLFSHMKNQNLNFIWS